MQKTKNERVPAFSRLHFVPIKIVDTYSLSSSNKNPVETKINSNATANPPQTLYQPHTAPNLGPSACLISSTSVPSVI